MRTGLWTWVLVVLSLSACAGHKIRHTATDESQPHITWEFRTGGEEGEERVVCESAQAKPLCALPVGPIPAGTGGRALSTFHLYMHSASQVATYEGTIFLPFFEGANDRSGRAISVTVKPGDAAQSISVTGLTASKAGTHALRIALKVTIGGKPAPDIKQEVKVVLQ